MDEEVVEGLHVGEKEEGERGGEKEGKRRVC